MGKTVSGTVISVADGDTVRLKLDSGQTIRVRLEGIDTPERGEPFNTQARNATRVMLFDKTVQVKATDVDSYDRLVARLVVNGTRLQAWSSCRQASRVTSLASPTIPLWQRRSWPRETRDEDSGPPVAPKPACVKFTNAQR